jgi:hypothetical protein
MMARNVFILIFCATIAVLIGVGLYESLRSGSLTIKGRTSRRAHEPISYWLGMFVVAFAFVVLASGAAFMGFLVVDELVWGP